MKRQFVEFSNEVIRRQLKLPTQARTYRAEVLRNGDVRIDFIVPYGQDTEGEPERLHWRTPVRLIDVHYDDEDNLVKGEPYVAE